MMPSDPPDDSRCRHDDIRKGICLACQQKLNYDGSWDSNWSSTPAEIIEALEIKQRTAQWYSDKCARERAEQEAEMVAWRARRAQADARIAEATVQRKEWAAAQQEAKRVKRDTTQDDRWAAIRKARVAKLLRELGPLEYTKGPPPSYTGCALGIVSPITLCPPEEDELEETPRYLVEEYEARVWRDQGPRSQSGRYGRRRWFY